MTRGGTVIIILMNIAFLIGAAMAIKTLIIITNGGVPRSGMAITDLILIGMAIGGITMRAKSWVGAYL